MSVASRKRYREAGLCCMCGKVKMPAGKRCKSCREIARVGQAARRKERRRNGLCIDCNNPADGYSIRCIPCKRRQVKLQRKHQMEMQKRGICIYCLTPMSADEIKMGLKSHPREDCTPLRRTGL